MNEEKFLHWLHRPEQSLLRGLYERMNDLDRATCASYWMEGYRARQQEEHK